jgi:hypothetical protein
MDWARVLLMLIADQFQKDYVDKGMELLASNKESLLAAENLYRHMPKKIDAGDTAGCGENKN